MISSDILGKVPVFLGLDDSTLSELQEVVRRVHVPAGKLIFEEGAKAKDIYYLESGGARISMSLSMHLAGKHGTVAIIRQGECCGWSALVPPHEFTASATTIEDSVILMIDGDALRWRMKRHPELAWSVFENLAATISERLAGMHIRLITAEYEHKKPASEKSSASAVGCV